jgi:hypothetical protein
VPIVHRGRELRSRARIGCHRNRTMPRRASERRSDPGVHRARGCSTIVGRSSSSQARGIRGRTSQTRVTQDESQVSVGGMLALDQVLGDSWSC